MPASREPRRLRRRRARHPRPAHRHRGGVGPSLAAGDHAAEARRILRGHGLACWCPLDRPCHADVPLGLANR
ncbi:DUF4326 domain-containing protein [Geodermatophilus africanus]|uniref:DUF4326 domain-containing protein n=1 Tax=Geodermatophilus africanus TaxID=1137993 RepID=UPI000B847C78